MLMPGVQLSAGVITTDAPLFLFLALALWAYAGHDHERARRRAGCGGRPRWAWRSDWRGCRSTRRSISSSGWSCTRSSSPRARAVWGRREVALVVGLCLLALAPNLAWNMANGFATLGHTMLNASWGPPVADPGGAARRAGRLRLPRRRRVPAVPVRGVRPDPLRRAAGRRRRPGAARAPDPGGPAAARLRPAAAAHRAGAGGHLQGQRQLGRGGLRRGLGAGRGLAGAVAGAADADGRARRPGRGGGPVPGRRDLAARPPTRLGLGNSFKRARGWAAATQAIIARAEAERGAGALDAIAVDDRFLFNAMDYYGRDYFRRPGAPRLGCGCAGRAPTPRPR